MPVLISSSKCVGMYAYVHAPSVGGESYSYRKMRLSVPSGIWIIKSVKSAIWNFRHGLALKYTYLPMPVTERDTPIQLSQSDLKNSQKCGIRMLSTRSKTATVVYIINLNTLLYPHCTIFEEFYTAMLRHHYKKDASRCAWPRYHTHILLHCCISDLEKCICQLFPHTLSDSSKYSQLYTLTYVWPTNCSRPCSNDNYSLVLDDSHFLPN